VIVDSLTFVGDGLYGVSATVDALLRALDAVEADRAVVCPLRPRGYHLGPANDVVADAVEQHPDRLSGFGRVDPNLVPDAEHEAERILGGLGLRGIFLHPWEETFRANAPVVDAVIEVARAHGAPVMVASGYPWLSEGLQVGDLAGRFPDVTFVGTNGLQLNISGLGQTDAEAALRRNANLVVQTAGVYREDFLEGVAERLGAARVLYASAFPYCDPRLELKRVTWSHLDEEARAAILGGNAARLLLRA
jgi:predicted TIM-barrel fold metal-dependent hydrolase